MEENYLHCRTESSAPEVGRKVALLTGITGKTIDYDKDPIIYWNIPTRAGWFLSGRVPPGQGLHRPWHHPEELLLQHWQDIAPV